MQNQSSPVQILSPVIPKSWCPEGTWSDVFNSYNQLFLNNSTINIPFLNEVTPQQITAIQQSILTITNKLDAVNWQSGNITIAASASGQTFTINLPVAINSANYNISGYFNATSGTANSNSSWGVIGTPTTTYFQIWVFNPAANTEITKFTWQVSNLGAL
jgi:hypothetical protein